METTHKRYAQIWLSLTLLALLAIATFNVLVDPIGAYTWGNLSWFEPYRYVNLDRMSRAEMAARGNWETVILGSSRAKNGLPATHPFFAQHPTCNPSLDGARIPELEAVLDFTRRRNPLKHVFLCLDFFMFGKGSDSLLNFDETLFGSNVDYLRYYCDGLLGLPAIKASRDLVRDKLAGKPVDPQFRLGFSHHQLEEGTVQRERIDRVLRIAAPGYLFQKTDPAYYEGFRRIIRECRDHQIQLDVAIMPVHALDLELLYSAGLWPEFEQWKQKLLEVLAEEGVEQGFSLWDFTGYRGPSIEPVPPLDSPSARMKYFLESSHCTDVTGWLMLDAMIEGKTQPDFGVQMTAENLQAHLARIREDRELYVQANPEELLWIQRIVEEARQSQQ